MANARSSQALANRERARLARLTMDAERVERDELIEQTAAEIFTDLDEGQALRQQLAVLDQQIGARVQKLAEKGRLSNRSIAVLLGLDAAEVRRLRTPATDASSTGKPTDADEPSA